MRGVSGALTLVVGVDERLVAEHPLNLIGVWDRRGSTPGDEGGVAWGRFWNDGDARGIKRLNVFVCWYVKIDAVTI